MARGKAAEPGIHVLASHLRLALDPCALAARAGFELDPWQADYLTARPQRALLAVGRQCGKTTAAAIDVAHEIMFRRARDVLVIAPTQRQSSEFVRRVRQVLRRLPDPPKLATDAVFSIEVADTGSRVVALPGGDADNIRGYSPHVVYIDEAARVDEANFNAIRPMLAATQGRLIALSTPDGRTGNPFASLWFDGGPQWDRTLVPATEVSRIPASFLEEERAEMSDRAFRAEYLVEFIDSEDQVFSAALIAQAFTDTEGAWTPTPQ